MPQLSRNNDFSNFNDLIKYVVDFNPTLLNLMNFRLHFEKYLNLCNKQNIYLYIDELRNNPNLSNILDNNAHILFIRIGIEPILYMTRSLSFNERFAFFKKMYVNLLAPSYTLSQFIDDLLTYGEDLYIDKHLSEIISSFNIKYLIDANILKKLHEYFPESFSLIHEKIVSEMAYPKAKKTDERTINALTIMIDEIAENEGTDLSKLKYLGHGEFSDVYRLGDKVIKLKRTHLGSGRVTPTIPYHRRILQPLVRREISSDFKSTFIEIAEYVEIDPNITKEEVYSIWKELRESGIVWADPGIRNLGRLKKDNIIHMNYSLNVAGESLGYIKDTIHSDIPLKKGDLVIIDTDLIFRKETFSFHKIPDYIYSDTFLEFEERYRAEKKAEKKKTFSDYLSKSDNNTYTPQNISQKSNRNQEPPKFEKDH